jgi:hypothetical protein
MPSIIEVWPRIKKHEGDTFKTITGLEFSYSIDGNIINPSRTNQNIPKSHVEKLLERVPIKNPGEISDDVRGSAYLWGILHDERISNGDW